MPKHVFKPLKGKVVRHTLSSKHLEKNLLGDPSKREVSVYLPENYETSKEEYPLFLYLAPFTGSGLKALSWSAFGETLPQRIERLIEEKKMGPALFVFPDCFTSLGGNQYINSEAMGNWADYLHEEVIPFVDQNFRTKKTKESRAVFGKSSGGYGALVYGMKYAKHWGAVACQSGDMDFDLMYQADFPKVLTKLAQYEGSTQSFIEKTELSPTLSGDDFCTLMILAMCASYAPNKDKFKGIELPVTEKTCEFIEELWKKWLKNDPLHMVEEASCQENLKSLNGLYLDCGFRDQYHLHYGARQLTEKLEEYSIPHSYEEFDGTHSNTNHRMDISLPFLYKKLK